MPVDVPEFSNGVSIPLALGPIEYRSRPSLGNHDMPSTLLLKEPAAVPLSYLFSRVGQEAGVGGQFRHTSCCRVPRSTDLWEI